jgi:TonB family protein
VIAATVVLLAARFLIPWQRRRSAAARHLLWLCALASASVIPVLAWLMPRAGPLWLGTVVQALPTSVSGLAAVTPEGVVVRATGLAPTTWSWADAWWEGWAAGAIVCTALLALRLVRLATIARAAVTIDDRDLGGCVGRAARRLGIEPGAVRLVRSSAMAVPATWGWYPCIVIPLTVERWPRRQLEMVLLHELAHVRRRDWLTHMLAELVCAVFWFNPMFWIARNALRRESEHAADDVVLSSGEDPAAYADALVDVVRTARGRLTPSASVAVARPSDLSGRITSVLAIAANRSRPTRRSAVAAIGGAVLVAYAAIVVSSPTFAAEVRMLPPRIPRVLESRLVADADSPVTPPGEVRIAGHVNGSVLPPRVAQYTTPPLYSDDARRRRIQGLVTVRVHLNEAGRVDRARIAKGLGFGLDENALVAVRQWHFTPALADDRPIAVDADVDVQFSLRHEALNELIANDMATQVGPGVVPPRVVRTERPTLESGAGGRVVLDVVVHQDGTPRIVRILDSGGEGFDEAAVRAFEGWRFTPATKDGRPVKVRMTAEITING